MNHQKNQNGSTITMNISSASLKNSLPHYHSANNSGSANLKEKDSLCAITSIEIKICIVVDSNNISWFNEALGKLSAKSSFVSSHESKYVLESENPDILITDDSCPISNSIDILELSKSINPDSARILFVESISKFFEYKEKIFKLLDIYLVRPCQSQILSDCIFKLIDSSYSRQSFYSVAMNSLKPLIERVQEHEVFELINDIKSVRIFLEYHCFAVWDFMSLLKTLQDKTISLSFPWTPPNNLIATRMINEIILAEESDITHNGNAYLSHFELYLSAMDEAGASSDSIRYFIALLNEQMHYKQALNRANVPKPASRFVTNTLEMCLNHPTHELASYFLFGREQIIPDMFLKLIESISEDNNNLDTFIFYLKRHIDLDKQDHGPAAERMLYSFCGSNKIKWHQALKAAESALFSRIELWDGIATAIRGSSLDL